MKLLQSEIEAIVSGIRKLNEENHSEARFKEDLIREKTSEGKILQGVRITIDFLDEVESIDVFN